MLPQLDTWGWYTAFKYARGGSFNCHHSHDDPELACPVDRKTQRGGFDRDDVVKILGLVDGENEGPSWVGLFLLHDGRYACLRV